MRTLILSLVLSLPLATAAQDRVRIDGGNFDEPIVREDRKEAVFIPPFELDARQVSNADFQAFLATHPEWRRDQAPALFRDSRYLEHWSGPLELGDGDARPDRPVTRVSWYAARAYCRAQGGRLPSKNEWEYVAAGQREALGQTDADYAHGLFAWYANPGVGNLAPVSEGPGPGLGVHDLHGLVLEWVEDFQLLIGSGETVDLLSGSCGDTARFLPEFDEAHYATFLRYQSRSNYSATTTTSTLGFRCAYDLEELQ